MLLLLLLLLACCSLLRLGLSPRRVHSPPNDRRRAHGQKEGPVLVMKEVREGEEGCVLGWVGVRRCDFAACLLPEARRRRRVVTLTKQGEATRRRRRDIKTGGKHRKACVEGVLLLVLVHVPLLLVVARHGVCVCVRVTPHGLPLSLILIIGHETRPSKPPPKQRRIITHLDDAPFFPSARRHSFLASSRAHAPTHPTQPYSDFCSFFLSKLS